jgi:hypothetical protein
VTAPPQMALALQVALALPADNPGRVVAQREIVTSLEAALDARRPSSASRRSTRRSGPA